MKNSAYWQKRFETLEEALGKYGEETYRGVQPYFDKAIREINADIETWMYRIAKNNEISMANAKKLLDANQLEEFKWSVEEYIKYGKENAINQQWIKQLENASAKFHISRLEALKIQVQQSAEKAFGNYLDDVDSMAKKVYEEGYYRSAFELQRGFGIGWNIASIDEKKLSKLISKPWAADGKNFSDRIWQAKSQMVYDLHSELTRACILGKGPDEAIKNLSKYVNKRFKNAKVQAGRLVMTEQAFFSSAAQKDCFNELGVEEYEIVATLDSHTSEICQELDGKHFPMSQYEEGVTAPPFHVWCRSTTCPYFDDEFTVGEMRAARGEDGKTYYVPADMTYPEWKDSIAKGQGKSIKLGAGFTNKSTETIREVLGKVDSQNRDIAINYYNNLIRNEAVEHGIVIQEDGTLIHFAGSENSLDMTDFVIKGATITHNHPASNGIVSFGEDDFYFLREHPEIEKLIAVNEKYTYTVKVLKDLSEIVYTDLQQGALKYIDDPDFEMQHAGFLYLKENGYVDYDRQEIK